MYDEFGNFSKSLLKKYSKKISYYFNGNLEFIGEYLNEKRNGKGKEYNKDNELIFEGEYLNGEKKEGKEYNDNDKLKFEVKY